MPIEMHFLSSNGLSSQAMSLLFICLLCMVLVAQQRMRNDVEFLLILNRKVSRSSIMNNNEKKSNNEEESHLNFT